MDATRNCEVVGSPLVLIRDLSHKDVIHIPPAATATVRKILLWCLLTDATLGQSHTDYTVVKEARVEVRMLAYTEWGGTR